MNPAKRLLVVYHSQTGNTERMLEAVLRGATDPAITHIEVVTKSALLATPEDVLAAQAILLGTPENFGYMSGAMKYFFDHVYYPCLEHTPGRPYGLFIRAGNDGRGALMSIQRIVAGLRWKLVCEPVIAAGEMLPWHFEACETLGTTMAAGLEAGVF